MARFQFGKGKKKTYWDVEQLGRVLRARESGGASDMLPGYRTFANEKEANIQLGRLVADKLKSGFSPADTDANELAAAFAPSPVAAPAAPTLPLRRDLSIYNEANGLMVLSMSMAGKNIEESSKKWDKAVADGKMIPLSLIQDDPFIVRVVAGEALNAQEEEEWVARLDWWLDVPDGKLAITGGAVLVNEEYDEDDLYYAQYIGVVDVPPGRYRVSIYSYVPGINGSAVLDHLAGGYGKSEAFGKWFRRTRPGQPFPAWLRDWNIGDLSTDPGHEDEWKSQKRPDDSEMPDLVHFLVHLDPAKEKDSKERSSASIVEGWFGEAEGARQIEKCPLGIVARDVVKSVVENQEGGWIYVEDIFARTAPFPLAKIDGGPLTASAAQVADLCRLSWFSHRFSVPSIRAKLPAGSSLTLPQEAPPETLVFSHDGEFLIALNGGIKPAEMIKSLVALTPQLASLPDGTKWEIGCSQFDQQALQAEVPEGLHRYSGSIRQGAWQIEEAFPPVSAGTLKAALALSAEVAAGDSIKINNEAEGEAILKWAEGNFGVWIEDNPGKIEDGTLMLGERDEGVIMLYGASTFAIRYRDTWPVPDLSDDEDEDDDLSMPIQGRKILEAPGGRIYFATMALMVSEELVETIQKEERMLKQLGFIHVADLVCDSFENIAFRGYAKEGGDTWAIHQVAVPNILRFEMSTRFSKDDASLLTTRKPGAEDHEASHFYSQSANDGDFAAMLALHETRKTELSERFGQPLATERKAEAFANALEAAFKKRFDD